MPSTYTNNGFILQQDGTGSGVWGDLCNTNFQMIDQATDGFVQVDANTATITLSVTDGALSNGRCKTIQFVGSPTSTYTVNVAPVNIQKLYWMSNQTTQSMIVANGAGTGTTVPPGSCVPIQLDGIGNTINLYANPVIAQATITDLSVPGSATLPGGTAITISGVQLPDYIESLIPSFTSISGNLVLSGVSAFSVTGATWAIFTFGTTPGTRFKLAYGNGQVADGGTITLPGGFPTDGSNQIINVSVGSVVATSGSITSVTTAYNGASQIANAPTKGQTGGGSPTVTIAWNGVCWLTNQ